MSPLPSVGRVVHYVSRGSLDGVFPPTCRAAIVTEVDGTLASVAVLNPTGLFFDLALRQEGSCAEPTPGTWHWPERV